FRFVLVAHNRRTSLFQFSMGCAFAGDRLFIDLFRAVAAVATETFVAAGISDPGYSAGFASWFVFAQASFVLIDGDFRSGEVNERRRQLVELNCARLSLLVATAADSVWLVGGQKSRVVQAFFSRVLSRGGDHRAIFHLGAAASKIDCCRTADFSSTRDRDHG